MQVSSGMDPEMSAQDFIWAVTKTSRGGASRSGFPEREQDSGGYLQADYVHMLVSIPPKYSVAQVVGFIKGKSAIHIARTYMGRRRNYHGMHFWARGYYVSTVGADEESVRD
jgi:hypothetical protein